MKKRATPNSLTSKKAELTGPTWGYHQGQTDGAVKAVLPSPHKQTELSAPELEGRPPSCFLGELPATPWGSRCLHFLPAVCTEDRALDDWWEERRPILGCSVFPGPVCRRWFLLSVLLPPHPAWLQGGADAFSPWWGEPLGPLSSRGWWAARQGSVVPRWGPSGLPQPIGVAAPVTHEMFPTSLSSLLPWICFISLSLSPFHRSLSPKDPEHLEMQQSFYFLPLKGPSKKLRAVPFTSSPNGRN